MSAPLSGERGRAVARSTGTRPSEERSQALQAVGRLAANLGRLARDVVVAGLAARMSRDWLLLRLDHGVSEVPPASRWTSGWMPGPAALPVVLEALERLASDSRARGVLVRVGTASIGWAKLAALARGVERVRAAGKHVAVYATHGGNGAAWLGCVADHFWMAPPGRLDLVGVRVESPFVRRALEKLHIQPLVLQAGRYKSVGEMLERDSMSQDSRAALEAVVTDLYDVLVRALERRAGSPERARQWIDEGPYLASEALERGLVDRLLYPDELAQALHELETGGEAGLSADEAGQDRDSPEPRQGPEEPAGPASVQGSAGGGPATHLNEEPNPSLVLPDAYLRLTRPRFRWRSVVRPQARVAVLPVLGTIHAELARTLQVWLTTLRERTDVRAVVLRIDSPGGDPAASDLIWRAVCRFRERKPIVASMGDTAASGGYYAAMAANAIVAEATTLTGSIGVAMAGIELADALRELGVVFDGVQRGRHAGIYGLAHSHTDEEREILERQIRVLYADFVAKAADGRGMSPAALDEVAQGRVWSGEAARQQGLVDAAGGLSEAVERARELAGLDAATSEVIWLHPPSSALRRILGSTEDPYDAGLSTSARPVRRAAMRLVCPIRLELS